MRSILIQTCAPNVMSGFSALCAVGLFVSDLVEKLSADAWPFEPNILAVLLVLLSECSCVTISNTK
jgi:hypothetical protein